jgi:hypothetical protein
VARYVIPAYPDPAWQLPAAAAERAFLERYPDAASVTHITLRCSRCYVTTAPICLSRSPPHPPSNPGFDQPGPLGAQRKVVGVEKGLSRLGSVKKPSRRLRR